MTAVSTDRVGSGPAAYGARRQRLLRLLARRRGLRVAVLLSTPALLVVVVDFVNRGGRLLDFPPKYVGSYLVAVAESAILWGTLLASASARRGWLRWFAATLFVLLATVVVGSQLYFYGSYATYLNLDATLFGTSMTDSTLGQLRADSRNFVMSVSPPLLAALALVWLGRKGVRTRRRAARWLGPAIPGVLVAALFIPCSYRSIQGSTPDVLYFHAIGGLVKQLSGIEARRHVSPGRRNPPRLPQLSATPSLPRNVLLVLTESVPRSVGCPHKTASCPVMPFTNEALPARMPLEQMRSTASATAIQLAVLWSGLQPDAGREALHTAPLLFDYAHAAGYETAYWSSHHPMFANTRLYVQDLPTRFQCSATHLDPLADIDLGADDRLLTARILEQLGELKEPFFAVAHYGNTHMPYLVDDDDAPFQPAFASKAEKDNEAYRNYFKNAVHRQDKTIAELLRFVRGAGFGERTVILYTSDHGEQFREHGQLGHTGSLFDVELLVPSWVDAPPGTLSEEERGGLASYADQPTFHTDVAPTILDLLGLWDAPQLSAYRDAMVGGSLLRPGRPEAIIGMTNCSGVWGCAFENWGVMRGMKKLHAREWDRDWLCYDLAADPDEQSPLPLSSCASLRLDAERRFGHLPGKGSADRGADEGEPSK